MIRPQDALGVADGEAGPDPWTHETSDPSAAAPDSSGRVWAWDLPTRLFKWSLVVCVVAAWATNKYAVDQPYLHVWNGTAILVLLVFRLLWGLVGGSTARFSAFVTWPWTALRFAIAQVTGRGRPYLGHTPIAGQMVMALLLVLFAQAILGLYSSDPDRLIVEGPLAATVSEAAVRKASSLHRLGFNLLLILISAHVAANLIYASVSKGYLTAIITGRKERAAYADAPAARRGSLLLAAACLAVAIGLVFGGIALLGGFSASDASKGGPVNVGISLEHRASEC